VKIIGLMVAKNEADLLPSVLDTALPQVDHMFAVDDGSWDNTYEILRSRCDEVTKSSDIPPGYHGYYTRDYLYQQVQAKFPDAWVVSYDADYYFLNSPREICNRLDKEGYDRDWGIVLNLNRHPNEPWGELDTYPNWPCDIRHLTQWALMGEHRCFMYKVAPHISYANSRFPWPKGYKNPYHFNKFEVPYNATVIEHPGKRSPRYSAWKYSSGSRMFSSKWDETKKQDEAYLISLQRKFFTNANVWPWQGKESLKGVIDDWNLMEGWTKGERAEHFKTLYNPSIPHRTDI
tara:strand:- start:393 stop:1262 length:870 start_codon:yes stop_codon:yes gene_type:complete